MKKPNLTPKKMNTSIREIPVTISAFSMGIFVMPIQKVFPFLFMESIARQESVPIMVAMIADKVAIASVLKKACNMASLLKSETYHFVVKPPHLALDLLELKERTISVAMGAYINSIINAI